VARAAAVPTQTGDVLILHTAHTFCVYAVGLVTHDGQQGFNAYMAVHHAADYDNALAHATTLRAHGRRLFFLNIDTHRWRAL
jgi:hypothetical protein